MIGYGVSNSGANAGSMSMRVVPSGKVLLVWVFTQKMFTMMLCVVSIQRI